MIKCSCEIIFIGWRIRISDFPVEVASAASGFVQRQLLLFIADLISNKCVRFRDCSKKLDHFTNVDYCFLY